MSSLLHRSIKEAIPEIFAAYEAMSAAVDAHLSGNQRWADRLFREANSPKVWAWTNPTWERPDLNVRIKTPLGDTTVVPNVLRDPQRNPTDVVKRAVLARDGYRCRCCGIPVIGADVRKVAHRLYPDAVPWGRLPTEQHAGFQAMWLQYDHVVPHSHGGSSLPDNIVVTCALCNYGKDRYTLAQLGLSDPRDRIPEPCAWEGLRRLLGSLSLPDPLRLPARAADRAKPRAQLVPTALTTVPLGAQRGIVSIFLPGAWICKGYVYTPPIGSKERWFRLSQLVSAENMVRDGVEGCRIRCAPHVFARRGLDPSYWITPEK